MKKIFTILACLSILAGNAYANEAVKSFKSPTSSYQKIRQEREKAFENKLKLTEEQKIKAKEIRLKSQEKLKPIFEEIISKKQEAKMVKMSRIAVIEQEKRLNAIDKEIKALEKQAHNIRKANMKEFESILTKEQKNILKQMKKEGRKRYKEKHSKKN